MTYEPYAREARESYTPVGRRCEARAETERQSRSLFSASFQTFCLTVRAYLNAQKYGLFCSLDSSYETSLLRAYHYITSGHSCTIRKVSFVFFQQAQACVENIGAQSSASVFSTSVFPLSKVQTWRLHVLMVRNHVV